MADSKVKIDLSDEDIAYIRQREQQVFDSSVESKPADRESVNAGIRECYDILEKHNPQIFWTTGPEATFAFTALVMNMSSSSIAEFLLRHLAQRYDTQIPADYAYQFLIAFANKFQIRFETDTEITQEIIDNLYSYCSEVDNVKYHFTNQSINSPLVDPFKLDEDFLLEIYASLRQQTFFKSLMQNAFEEASLDAWWLHWSYHWLMMEELDKIEVPKDVSRKAHSWIKAHQAGVWIPLSAFAIVSDKHVSISLQDNTLHNTNQAAWEWADGSAIYAVNGIRMPDWVIKGENCSASRILNEIDNLERRRIAFELYGWDKAIKELDCELIDAHPDPHMGSLYSIPRNLLGAEATVLVVRNASPSLDGTWRDYALLASPNARTVLEAQASLAGVTVAKMEQLLRAT